MKRVQVQIDQSELEELMDDAKRYRWIRDVGSWRIQALAKVWSGAKRVDDVIDQDMQQQETTCSET